MGLDMRRALLLLHPAGGIGYLLRDEFTTALAAGSINGTAAEPGPGTRSVQDTGSHLSISSGALRTDGNGVGWGDPRIVYADVPIARADGVALFADIAKAGATDNNCLIGFADTPTPGSGADYEAGMIIGNDVTPITKTGLATITHNLISGAVLEAQCVVLRSAGFFHLAQIDNHWRLVHIEDTLNTATLYVAYGHSHVGGVKIVDYVRVPEDPITITPLASDSFDRANGALGSTDGGGHVEANGGGGLSWTSGLGTVEVDTNEASASAVDAGTSDAVATVPAGTLDILVRGSLTRGTNNVGLVARYKDDENFVFAYHDGANVRLYKRVAGADTQVFSTAKAYAAGATMTLMCAGDTFVVYYNRAQIGEGTISDAALQTHGACGLYFSDTDSTVDDFTVWAHGTNGEWD